MTTAPVPMKLRVSKRERKLHLSYQLPHRIHTSQIYPVTSANGSTIIIYGYDNGLRVLWRGGRRRRSESVKQSQSQGSQQSTEVVMLDEDDDYDEPSTEHSGSFHEFETEEEELDPDCPHPSIIQTLDLPTGSDILHVAVPTLSSVAGQSRLLRRVAIVAVSSADSALRILQIPLKPPSESNKEAAVKEIVRSQVELAPASSVPTSLCVKILAADSHEFPLQKKQKENVEGQLLVATSSHTLTVWSVPITADAMLTEEKTIVQRCSLQVPPTHLSFHPAPRSTQILLVDHTGLARIYEPYVLSTAHKRPVSSDSTMPTSTRSSGLGKWIAAFSAPFHSSKETPAVLARRKRILDAKWIASGKALLAVLEDGQWGVWDTSGSIISDKDFQNFALSGFLDAANSSEPAGSVATRKGPSKLAPMTPNTRKSKTEHLFAGTSKVRGISSRGGISVAVSNTKSGHVDECAALWYNSGIYYINSTHSFCHRSSTDNAVYGSLYAPSLSHLSDIDLCNENVTSISHFSAKTSNTLTGQINIQGDLLISTEHHLLVLQTIWPTTLGRKLFQLAPPASREKAITALTDIDRALEDMAAGTHATQRVGFATHSYEA